MRERFLASLAVPAFRRLWASSFFSIMAMMTGGLAIGWLTLSLTDSPFWVGAVAGLRGAGQLGFGVFAGVLIDRHEQRRLLVVTQLLTAVVLGLLGLLVLTDHLALWHILVAMLLEGCFTAIRAPAFNTIAYQMVGAARTLNAAAALNLGFNVARILGSAVVGLMIARWGMASGLILSAVCGFLAAFTLLFVRGRFQSAGGRESFWQAAGAGIRYAWANLKVRRLLSLSMVMETFGFSYNVILPVIARDVLGVGASGLGLLSSLAGVGATISTLGVASLGDYKNKGHLLAYSALAAGLSLILFALSSSYALSLALAMLVGASLMAYDVTMKAMFLLVASDEMRGRVQSIYTLTYGLLSLGGFMAGGVATVLGAPFAIGVGGGIISAFALRMRRHFSQLQAGADATLPAAD